MCHARSYLFTLSLRNSEGKNIKYQYLKVLECIHCIFTIYMMVHYEFYVPFHLFYHQIKYVVTSYLLVRFTLVGP